MKKLHLNGLIILLKALVCLQILMPFTLAAIPLPPSSISTSFPFANQTNVPSNRLIGPTPTGSAESGALALTKPKGPLSALNRSMETAHAGSFLDAPFKTPLAIEPTSTPKLIGPNPSSVAQPNSIPSSSAAPKPFSGPSPNLPVGATSNPLPTSNNRFNPTTFPASPGTNGRATVPLATSNQSTSPVPNNSVTPPPTSSPASLASTHNSNPSTNPDPSLSEVFPASIEDMFSNSPNAKQNNDPIKSKELHPDLKDFPKGLFPNKNTQNPNNQNSPNKQTLGDGNPGPNTQNPGPNPNIPFPQGALPNAQTPGRTGNSAPNGQIPSVALPNGPSQGPINQDNANPNALDNTLRDVFPTSIENLYGNPSKPSRNNTYPRLQSSTTAPNSPVQSGALSNNQNNPSNSPQPTPGVPSSALDNTLRDVFPTSIENLYGNPSKPSRNNTYPRLQSPTTTPNSPVQSGALSNNQNNPSNSPQPTPGVPSSALDNTLRDVFPTSIENLYGNPSKPSRNNTYPRLQSPTTAPNSPVQSGALSNNQNNPSNSPQPTPGVPSIPSGLNNTQTVHIPQAGAINPSPQQPLNGPSTPQASTQPTNVPGSTSSEPQNNKNHQIPSSQQLPLQAMTNPTGNPSGPTSPVNPNIPNGPATLPNSTNNGAPSSSHIPPAQPLPPQAHGNGSNGLPARNTNLFGSNPLIENSNPAIPEIPNGLSTNNRTTSSTFTPEINGQNPNGIPTSNNSIPSASPLPPHLGGASQDRGPHAIPNPLNPSQGSIPLASPLPSHSPIPTHNGVLANGSNQNGSPQTSGPIDTIKNGIPAVSTPLNSHIPPAPPFPIHPGNHHEAVPNHQQNGPVTSNIPPAPPMPQPSNGVSNGQPIVSGSSQSDLAGDLLNDIKNIGNKIVNGNLNSPAVNSGTPNNLPGAIGSKDGNTSASTDPIMHTLPISGNLNSGQNSLNPIGNGLNNPALQQPNTPFHTGVVDTSKPYNSTPFEIPKLNPVNHPHGNTNLNGHQNSKGNFRPIVPNQPQSHTENPLLDDIENFYKKNKLNPTKNLPPMKGKNSEPTFLDEIRNSNRKLRPVQPSVKPRLPQAPNVLDDIRNFNPKKLKPAQTVDRSIPLPPSSINHGIPSLSHPQSIPTHSEPSPPAIDQTHPSGPVSKDNDSNTPNNQFPLSTELNEINVDPNESSLNNSSSENSESHTPTAGHHHKPHSHQHPSNKHHLPTVGHHAPSSGHHNSSPNHSNNNSHQKPTNKFKNSNENFSTSKDAENHHSHHPDTHSHHHSKGSSEGTDGLSKGESKYRSFPKPSRAIYPQPLPNKSSESSKAKSSLEVGGEEDKKNSEHDKSNDSKKKKSKINKRSRKPIHVKFFIPRKPEKPDYTKHLENYRKQMQKHLQDLMKHGNNNSKDSMEDDSTEDRHRHGHKMENKQIRGLLTPHSSNEDDQKQMVLHRPKKDEGGVDDLFKLAETDGKPTGEDKKPDEESGKNMELVKFDANNDSLATKFTHTGKDADAAQRLGVYNGFGGANPQNLMSLTHRGQPNGAQQQFGLLVGHGHNHNPGSVCNSDEETDGNSKLSKFQARRRACQNAWRKLPCKNVISTTISNSRVRRSFCNSAKFFVLVKTCTKDCTKCARLDNFIKRVMTKSKRRKPNCVDSHKNLCKKLNSLGFCELKNSDKVKKEEWCPNTCGACNLMKKPALKMTSSKLRMLIAHIKQNKKSGSSSGGSTKVPLKTKAKGSLNH